MNYWRVSVEKISVIVAGGKSDVLIANLTRSLYARLKKTRFHGKLSDRIFPRNKQLLAFISTKFLSNKKYTDTDIKNV